MLLAHEDHSNLRALAAHADRLMAFSGWPGAETVAVAAAGPDDEVVAAVKPLFKKQQKGKFGKSGGQQCICGP